jgi:hypothetical protein
MHNWKIDFSGDKNSKLSLSEFLEAIWWKQIENEMTDKELLRGAHNLFTGPALRWFKANFRKWGDFKDLKADLVANFRPPDYDERLWDQLRLRTQEKDEPLNLYISEMQFLFSLLDEQPTEKMKLNFIQARLNPLCLDKIPKLREIKTIDALCAEWIDIESVRSRKENYRPPTAPENPIEPNLVPKKQQKEAAKVHAENAG